MVKIEKIEKIEQDCKMGIKAFQNINAAALGFEKMIAIGNSPDPVLLAATFYWAVIRYSKPFLSSQTETGKIIYPIKHLRNLTGFVLSTHEHLIQVRNTLVAHDDFTEIPPRLLVFGMNFKEDDFMIPTSIALSNKCISFPSDVATVFEMKKHCDSCKIAVYEKLLCDIGLYREEMLKDTSPASSRQHKYQNNYGDGVIKADGSSLNPPDFMQDQWLNAPVPDHSDIHSGYQYEESKIKRDFHGPEKITTPSGNVIDIQPNGS